LTNKFSQVGCTETHPLHPNQASSSPPRSDGLPPAENDKEDDLIAGKHKFYSNIADELLTAAKK
jgi:hypothetical protein